MIHVRHLFAPLDDLLNELLNSLNDQEWLTPTSAGNWTVKEVASHLLDGNLRALSIQRDRFFGENPPKSGAYEDLVSWLNELNNDWIRATRRLSPQVLCTLHRITGPEVTRFYNRLPLNEKALFPVDWAGETESLNWMHLAREYTEKWHHQQQIREIRNDHLLMKDPYFSPYVMTSLSALPWLYRELTPEAGTTVSIEIVGECPVRAFLVRGQNSWTLHHTHKGIAKARVRIPAALSWKLFSKNIRYADIRDQVTVEGDAELGRRALDLVAVMA